MDYLNVAENFAKGIWKVKEEANLKDIMLFGSLTYNKPNPRDIDIMILHENPLLDKFQFEIIDKKISDIQKLFILSEILGEKIDLEKIIANTNIKELIEKGLFNTKYLNVNFFTDNEYRTKWIKNNEEHHDRTIKKARIDNENFEACIFRQGRLWNSNTEKYDVPARTKYKV
jgi:predicted nucleotidyltransferase